nr:phenylalanine--tRNA ligase alpha subunit, cytoplasmic isoform X2 [Tanacetum cinerariifolium]
MILYGIDNIRDIFGHKVDLSIIQKNPICRIGEDTNQPPQPLIASESPQMVLYVKLHILKKGEYIIWTMKMEQPEVLLPMGFPEDVGVIAWGLSLERPTMILYGIDNIRDIFGHKVDLSIIQKNPICRMGLQYSDKDEIVDNISTLEPLLSMAIVLRHKVPHHMLMNSCSHFLLINPVAMLSTRVKRFYKKTGRKLEFNGKEPVGFDKTNVECFNCHRRGHFSKDYGSARNSRNRSRDVRNAGYRGRDNGKRPAKEEDENALVVQDGLDTYDWSYQVEEETTDFALMAFTLNLKLLKLKF